jgi:hypothetical protein
LVSGTNIASFDPGDQAALELRFLPAGSQFA